MRGRSSMSHLARRLILGMGGNRTVTGLMTRHGLKAGAGRFVAGETLEKALTVTRKLNQQGLAVTLDLLGESVTDERTARAMAGAVGQVVEGIAAQGLDANLSLKLTQIGLDINPDLAYELMVQLQDRAIRHGLFIRIDMESSAVTDVTLDITRRLYARHDNVGTVLQSYLYRSPKDRDALAQLGMNLRFVKGAYLEPPEVAYPAKTDVDSAFHNLVAQHMESGCYAAIATHDDTQIDLAERVARERRIPLEQFEFQMLYGIRTERQLELVRKGYRTRVYVPYGPDWYPYFVRRLAERPANLWFVAKNLINR